MVACDPTLRQPSVPQRRFGLTLQMAPSSGETQRQGSKPEVPALRRSGALDGGGAAPQDAALPSMVLTPRLAWKATRIAAQASPSAPRTSPWSQQEPLYSVFGFGGSPDGAANSRSPAAAAAGATAGGMLPSLPSPRLMPASKRHRASPPRAGAGPLPSPRRAAEDSLSWSSRLPAPPSPLMALPPVLGSAAVADVQQAQRHGGKDAARLPLSPASASSAPLAAASAAASAGSPLPAPDPNAWRAILQPGILLSSPAGLASGSGGRRRRGRIPRRSSQERDSGAKARGLARGAAMCLPLSPRKGSRTVEELRAMADAAAAAAASGAPRKDAGAAVAAPAAVTQAEAQAEPALSLHAEGGPAGGGPAECATAAAAAGANKSATVSAESAAATAPTQPAIPAAEAAHPAANEEASSPALAVTAEASTATAAGKAEAAPQPAAPAAAGCATVPPEPVGTAVVTSGEAPAPTAPAPARVEAPAGAGAGAVAPSGEEAAAPAPARDALPAAETAAAPCADAPAGAAAEAAAHAPAQTENSGMTAGDSASAAGTPGAAGAAAAATAPPAAAAPQQRAALQVVCVLRPRLASEGGAPKAAWAAGEWEVNVGAPGCDRLSFR